jgi:hypothetical protein
MLLACNTPAQIYPRKDQSTQTDIIYSFRHHYTTFDRIAILARADSMLDRWHANLPKHLQAPKSWEEALKMDGDARFIQSLRLSIAHVSVATGDHRRIFTEPILQNLIRALIARERIAIDLKDKQSFSPGPLTPSAIRAEESCENIIRLYSLLSARDLLKSFGMQQIQHLAACGHTFLATMVIYSNISATGIRRLEDTIRLLQQRSQFPSALRAVDILRDMACGFGIRISGESRTGDKVTWMRMLHRKNGQTSPPAQNSPEQTPFVEPIPDGRWLEMAAAGRPAEAMARPPQPPSRRPSMRQSMHPPAPPALPAQTPPQPPAEVQYAPPQPIYLPPQPQMQPQPPQQAALPLAHTVPSHATVEIPAPASNCDVYSSYEHAQVDLQEPWLLQPAAAPAYEADMPPPQYTAPIAYGYDAYGVPVNMQEMQRADFYGGARRQEGPGAELPQDSLAYMFHQHQQTMQNVVGQ